MAKSKQEREYYLIDGYNVIHSWKEFTTLQEDYSAVRDALIHILSEYGAYEDYEIELVFDAVFTADGAHVESVTETMCIVYTGEGETADSYIERRAYEAVRKGREVYVVTSDAAEQSVILGAGAYRIPSQEFRSNVHRAKQNLRKEYLAPKNNLVQRNSVGSRIDGKSAAKLDALRKKR